MRAIATAIVLVLPCLAFAGALQAQTPVTLPLKREQPVIEWQGCPPAGARPATPSDQDRAEAARLAGDANEATLIGDNPAALSLLTRAAALDPYDGRIAYLRARTLELLGHREDALAEYCRYTRLAPDGVDREEAADRITELAAARGFAVPAVAADRHASGLARMDAGQPERAAAAFDSAVSAAPAWAAAIYNRGVARLTLGQVDGATADLRHYLQLSPGADDFDTILDVLGQLQVAPSYNPGAALAVGLVIPGMGHFTTGRPRRGALFLGGAAAMIGGGLLVTTTRVECLSPPVDGHCQPDEVLRESTDRPLLLPALIAAGVTGVIGAIDAYRGARRAQSETPARGGASANGFSVLPADVDVTASGAHVTLLRLRF